MVVEIMFQLAMRGESRLKNSLILIKAHALAWSSIRLEEGELACNFLGYISNNLLKSVFCSNDLIYLGLGILFSLPLPPPIAESSEKGDFSRFLQGPHHPTLRYSDRV